MRLSKTIKRIVALGTGATMLGATMMGAMAAADLKDYPGMFINKDTGAFNALIVVGDGVSSSDVVGAIELATNLQYASRVKKTISTGGGASVTVTGDAKKIEESTNKLELNENLTSVRTSVIAGDLNALADGSINNEYGTFDYKQTLNLPRGRVIFAKDTSNSANLHDDDVAADYLILPQGTEGYRMKITFSPALKSDHNTGGSGYLEDIRNKKIKLLGKEYNILKADHTAVNSVSLTLMAGAISDIMSEGETKTYTLSGKEYEVTLDFVGSVETKFTVNGQVTDALEETETFRLSDGIEVGVVDILSQEFAGGTRKVEFNLGANKLVLADTNTASTTSGGTVTIGTEDSSNVKVDIKSSGDGGVASGADVFISSIELYYKPSEDLYVGKGESASAIADAVEDEKGVFFLNGFDVKYEGLSLDSPEDIKIRSASNNDYKLEFTNKAGVKYSQAIWGQASGTANITVGDNIGSTVRALNIFESNQVADEEFFIVSRNKYSRIMQFKDIDPGVNSTDNTADGAGKVKFKDVGSGDLLEVSYSGYSGDLVLDGNTYKVNVTTDATTGTVYVDLDGSGNIPNNSTIGSSGTNTTISNVLYTKNEALIQLGMKRGTGSVPSGDPGTYNASTEPNNAFGNLGFNMSYVVFSSEDDEDNVKTNVTLVFNRNGDNELDIARIEGTDVSSNRVGTTYVYEDYIYNATVTDTGSLTQPAYGYKVGWDQKGSGNDQDDVTITYPDNQARANVFVTSGVTSTAKADAKEGVITYYETTPISVGAAVLASEAGDVKAKNVILVGGPCANAASSTIMGNPQPCAKGFESGKAMIKLYENAGNVAVLVAGADAADTRRASRVLAMYEKYAAQLKGTEVEVAGTSFTDISVSAPTPKPAETTTTTPAAGSTATA